MHFLLLQDLDIPSRKLVGEHDVLLGQDSWKEYEMFLFNDLLLLVRGSKRLSFHQRVMRMVQIKEDGGLCRPLLFFPSAIHWRERKKRKK